MNSYTDAEVIVEYPSGRGELIVSDPDVNGVVIVRDESGEYRRVASSVIKKLNAKKEKEQMNSNFTENSSQGIKVERIIHIGCVNNIEIFIRGFW